MMINKENLYFALRIVELRTKVLNINIKNALQGVNYEDGVLLSLDSELSMLMKSLLKYDFISQINNSRTLLVGEGNLSFSVCIVKKLRSFSNLLTSTYEKYIELSDFGRLNAILLREMGLKILHDLDATKLHEFFSHDAFETIIFQFPHSGSREGVDGLNSNYVLVRDFIISASKVLRKDGTILITIVDSNFYNSVFRFNELSEELGIARPAKYKFDPKDYPEYEHTMTHQDQSGIDDYSKFATYEFRI